MRRPVSRHGFEKILEHANRVVPASSTERFERRTVPIREELRRVIELAGEAEWFVDLDRLRLPFQDDEIDLTPFDDATRARPGPLADERPRTKELVRTFETRRRDDSVAEHRIVRETFASDHARDHLARVEADPRDESHAVLAEDLLLDFSELAAELDDRAAGFLLVIREGTGAPHTAMSPSPMNLSR